MSNPSAALPVQMQSLERRVQELELSTARVTGERDSLQERLQVLESSKQELAQEFIILKSNYLALGRELEQEVREAAGLSPELPAPPHTDLCAGALLGFWFCVPVTAQLQGGFSYNSC